MLRKVVIEIFIHKVNLVAIGYEEVASGKEFHR